MVASSAIEFEEEEEEEEDEEEEEAEAAAAAAAAAAGTDAGGTTGGAITITMTSTSAPREIACTSRRENNCRGVYPTARILAIRIRSSANAWSSFVRAASSASAPLADELLVSKGWRFFLFRCHAIEFLFFSFLGGFFFFRVTCQLHFFCEADSETGPGTTIIVVGPFSLEKEFDEELDEELCAME